MAKCFIGKTAEPSLRYHKQRTCFQQLRFCFCGGKETFEFNNNMRSMY
jgi:hypothetical protein